MRCWDRKMYPYNESFPYLSKYLGIFPVVVLKVGMKYVDPRENNMDNCHD